MHNSSDRKRHELRNMQKMIASLQTLTCLKSAIETLEKGKKYV